jgi:hypothetical protein
MDRMKHMTLSQRPIYVSIQAADISLDIHLRPHSKGLSPYQTHEIQAANRLSPPSIMSPKSEHPEPVSILSAHEEDVIDKLLDVCTHCISEDHMHLSHMMDRIGIALTQAFLNRAERPDQAVLLS